MGKPAPPAKWRKVRYTDDGASLFQCLSCKAQWESRTEPGYFATTVECDGGTPDARSYTQGDKTTYYVSCEPRYIPEWRHCPYCGIKWIGPIRCDVDNERMYGERKMRIQNAMTYEHHCPKPDYWYCVQSRAAQQPTMWRTNEIIDPRKHTIADALDYVKKLRRQEEHNCEGLEFCKPDLFRIKILKPSEIVGPAYSINERFYL